MSPRFVEQVVAIIKNVSDRATTRGDALEKRIVELEARLLDAEATIAAMRQVTR